MKARPILTKSISSILFVGTLIAGAHGTKGATLDWDGGATGGTELGDALNWSGDILPSVSVPDTAQWNGTVTGPLSLVYSNNVFAGAAGNTGLNLSVTATQVGSLNIDSGTNTASLRLNDVTIAAGAGAFSLGNGAEIFNVTLGGAGGQTHTWTNNSTNTATVASDVVVGLGGGGAHTLALGGAGNWTFNNAIGQGAGTLTLSKSGTGSLTLTGASTYTGGLVLNAGALNVNHASALGNTTAGALTITGGVIDNTSGAAITTTTAKAQSWNGDFTFTGTNNLNFNGGAVTIGGTAGTRTVNIAGGTLSTGLINAAAGFGLTKTGAGTLAMTSTLNTSNIAGILNIEAGKVQVSGDLTVGGLTGAGTIENGGAASKWFFVNNATDNTFSGTIQDNPANAAVRLGLVKRGAGTLNLTGANNTFTDRFAIENGTVRITGVNTTGYGTGANQAASIGTIANQNGILVIDGGTLNANKTNSPSIAIATAANSRGFIQMSSGTINSLSEFHIGRGQTGSFAALSMSGGTVNSGSWVAVGLNNDRAVLNQSGGTFNILANRMTIGAGGGGSIGIVTHTGGTLNVAAAASGGDTGLYVGENGLGHYTLSGTGEVNLNTNGSVNSGTVQFGKADSALGGNFNLNGGTLTAFGVTKGTSSAAAVYRFNFNGGTLKANGSNSAFFSDLPNTEAYIYGGGAKIDTNGHSITIGEPLLAPTGSGLASIAVTSAGIGYVDTPVVTITGGMGTGATAVANVSGGVVTGFTITNPGSGYSPDDVLTVTLAGGGATTPANVGAITFGANVSGGLDKSGAGTLTLTGFNSYTGATTVTNGELRLSGFSDISTSSGVTVNGAGAKLVQNSGVAMLAPVTLLNGTLDGTGSLGAVTVGDGTGAVITHGAGTGTPLTFNSLTFNGAATLNLTASDLTSALFTQALTTSANGKVTINVATPAGGWNLGNYNLIGYSTLGGQGLTGFQQGMIPNLGVRQSASLSDTGGFIALTIGGNLPVWTGAQNGNWTTDTIGGASNWKLQSGGAATDFITGDTVLFNDSATGTTVINISANVSPTSTTFDNSSLNYTVSSTGGFGIAGGTLVKNGSGAVSLAAPNTYAGGTTLNAGTLNLNHASAIGTGTLIINGGRIDNTSGAAVTLSTNNAQSWNADFEFGGTNNLNLGTGAVTLAANRTVTTSGAAALTLGGVVSGTGFGITKAGSGGLVLAGANSYTGATNVNGGTLTVTGSINAPNSANVGQISVANDFGNAVMRIVGGTVNASKTAAPGLVVGNAAGGAGVLIMDGGTINAASELWVGSPSGGSGSMTVNAGTVTSGSWLPVGRNGSGTLNVNGGSVTVNSQNFSLGSFSGANGDVNLSGGTTSTVSTAANQGIFIVGEGGTGVLTVSGSAALNVSGALGVQTARGDSGNGYVNLNGGTITTPAITKGAGGIGVFSFNGGTLRPTASNAAFMTGLTAAYVLPGGANIDTNGQDITIAQPLSAPIESGVKSITIENGGTGYIHAPVVRLSGGSGTGATAVANVSNGVITGITITNPGSGYTADDFVFASIEGGGAEVPAFLGSVNLAANNSTGGLNKQGSGTLTLAGENTYRGATTVSAGTLRLNGTGSINGSSGVTINGSGAKLVQANTVTPVSSTVNLTNGVLDGVGTINTVVVGNGTGGVITNGDGGTGVLTVGSLTFSGAGTANINTAGSAGIAVTGVLATNGPGTVTLNVPTGLLWTTGATYNLISFGSFNGTIGDFVTGNIAGLGARQTPAPVVNGSNIAMVINGDTPLWTGAASGAWTTAAVGSPFNWKLQAGGTGTEFLNNDQAIFDDSASGTTNVTINDATVAPSSVTFNNSTKDYTISGTAGISSGLLVKNGTRGVTISTPNTYTGGTTVNAGTLTLSGNNNFGTGALTVNGGTAILSGINTYTGETTVNAGALHVNNAGALGASVLRVNGGTLDNSSGAAVTLTNAIAQSWNGDFRFAGTRDLSFNNGPVTIGGELGQRTVNVTSGTLSTGLITAGAGYGLTKTGAGALAMTSTVNTTAIAGLLDIQEGTFRMSGDVFANGGLSGAGTIENGGAASKWFFVTSPTDTTFSGTIRDNPNNAAVRLGLVKRGAGTLNLTGANNITTDRFAVEQGAVRITGTYTTGAGTAGEAVVGNVANQNATLIIDGGTFNANRTSAPSMNIGPTANALGVLRMASGAINASGELWVGDAANSYGALMMSGGSITTGSWLPIARTGNGIAEISNGTIAVNGQNYTIASFAGANGVTNMTGGTINVLSTAANQGGFLVAEGGNATLNMSGTAAVNISGSRGLHFAAGPGTGVANLNGGTITTPLVQKGAGTGVLNFSGGTLKASGPSANFMEGLTAAYVNPGGAVIDDGGFNITVAQPLLAPHGGGVSSINFFEGGGYVGSPLVQITGDGTGATAVANLDDNGNLTGITVTNPGVGYTFASATLLGGGGSALADLANLSPNTSGGFTKKGTGTLTLSGVNTYTGVTTIEAGTLALTGSISGSTAIIPKAGARFDTTGVVGGFSLAGTQTLRGNGTVVGGVVMSEGSKLAPGEAGLGTLTFSGAFDLSLAVKPGQTGALLFDLDSPAASDKVAFASGALTIGDGVLGIDDFAFSNMGNLSSGTYTLFDGNAAIIGSLDAGNLTGTIAAGFTGTIELSDGGNDLTLFVIPEPGTATMLLAGLGSLCGFRRFRRYSI